MDLWLMLAWPFIAALAAGIIGLWLTRKVRLDIKHLVRPEEKAEDPDG